VIFDSTEKESNRETLCADAMTAHSRTKRQKAVQLTYEISPISSVFPHASDYRMQHGDPHACSRYAGISNPAGSFPLPDRHRNVARSDRNAYHDPSHRCPDC
jgi:hypothetical protein